MHFKEENGYERVHRTQEEENGYERVRRTQFKCTTTFLSQDKGNIDQLLQNLKRLRQSHDMYIYHVLC